jgi:hypothetical protein
MSSNKMKRFIPVLSFFILFAFFIPTISYALPANGGPLGLIVCDGTEVKCDFAKLLLLFQKGISALVKIATIITVLALIAMGIKLLTSQGNANALSEVKERAKWIMIGYVVILAAWLIIYTILNVLVDPDYNILKP